jgi:hypothetical protein
MNLSKEGGGWRVGGGRRDHYYNRRRGREVGTRGGACSTLRLGTKDSNSVIKHPANKNC